MNISIEEVNRLHIHEEVISDVAEKLASKIKSEGQFTNPIMADEKSLVVLDGMHRVAAVQKLGYRFLPVCLVDYLDPNVVLSSWHRVLSGISNLNQALEVIEELGFTSERSDWDSAYKLVENRVVASAVFSTEGCFAIHGTYSNVKELYDVIKRFENEFRSKGCSIAFDTADGVKKQLYAKGTSAGLMTPTITKQEVIQVALAGQAFPQKATRHIVPARPMMLNIPNEWLTGKISAEDANERVFKLLSSKNVKLLAGGQVLDRRYEEELYIFQ